MPKAVEAWVTAFKTAGFPLERDVIEALLESATDRVLVEGEILVRQGDDADSLFLVTEGRLGVSVGATDDAAAQVDEVGPFGIVGEIALLVGGKRSASVRALTRSTVTVITRESFGALTRERPFISEAFKRAVQTRLQRVKIAGHLRELLGEIDSDTLQQ